MLNKFTFPFRLKPKRFFYIKKFVRFCSTLVIFLILYTVFEYLPRYILNELKNFKLDDINEIRIRSNAKVSVILNGNALKLNLCIKRVEDIEEIVYNACKRSIYSYDEDIRNGFVTTDNGERIGLAGEFVINDKRVTAIRKFSSLVIRIPKAVNGFSKEFYNNAYNYKSVLILSRPGVGKTTFVRDLVKELSFNDKGNIVVIDERNEIASRNFKNFTLGDNVDVLTYSTKTYGFNQAIRTLNPDYIVTDELMSEEDSFGVLRAIYGGVNVIATVHAENIDELNSISYMKNIIYNKVFDNYVVIKKENNLRSVLVYDKDFNKLCLL